MTYTVTLQPSGRSYPCEPGVSILKAGLDAGLTLPYSCRTGVCRTCRGTVLEGKVDFGNVHANYLSDSDKARGLALLCSATPLSDVVVQARELDMDEATRPKFMPSRIFAMHNAAPDVMIVTLSLPMNEPMLYRAGQYIEFLLKDGKRRAYSIANPPDNEGLRQLELHIRLMPGGLYTEHVFNKMKLREVCRIEAPLGTFFLREDSDKPIVLLASGTGFAPIKALIEQLHHLGSIRPVRLYWGARTLSEIYLPDWIATARELLPQLEYVPVLSEPAAEDAWTGRTGFVHRAVMADFPDLSGSQVYACGAPIMVESAHRDFVAQCGLPDDEFYADSFTSEADKHGA